MDRLFCVVVRIKGARAAAKEPEERIESGTEYSRPLRTQRLFRSPVAVAAETTGALVVPTPTRAFFFASICLYLVSVSVIMKTLLLLRHAKAENAQPGSSDISRSLNERGKKEAQAIGTFIRKQNLAVELVLCSPAVRARETAELVLAAAEIKANLGYDQRIYETGPRQLLEVITEVDVNKSAVLLVGHNPGMEELLTALTGSEEPMATGTLAKIDFNFDEWSRIADDSGSLELIVSPNELAAG